MAKKPKETPKQASKVGVKTSSKPDATPAAPVTEVPPHSESAQLAGDRAKAPKRPIGTKAPITQPSGPTALAEKPAAEKPAAGKSAPKAKSPYSDADIALRAYFIAEKRRNAMLPGDEQQDWIEAERQLSEESGKPARKAAKA